ncbi:MAG: UDP-N-acetylglucosamine 2-epimerase (non-hydrolyzing) [Flavobacteriia bacterium]|nr:UDP-N-acetylglucosamine 2-epimerase (non-hydrolyzing) [Flavobacteriia bacterium]OJX34907.1 MAG: UDP-N-acetylglucosamine 2-epimerase [Flavobacteriia bacterium 40-80]
MHKKTIVALIGARPQIIKHSAIERAVQNHFADKINLVTIHSGQHYSPEMSAVFFEEMGISQPDINLNVGSSSHAQQTAIMMQKLDEYLDGHRCDAFLVYGDTNSTLAGALVASKRQVPLIHIEAGLRSFDKSMPEEINRILTDHVSSLLFCPTKTAVINLSNENVRHDDKGTMNNPSVFECGDIMYDNSLHFAEMAGEQSNVLSVNGLNPGAYILSTIHRDSNTDNKDNLSAIFKALLKIVEKNDIHVILPLHPRTKKMMEQLLREELKSEIYSEKRLKIIEPVGFINMIALEKNAALILTDSGGVQKEAYFFKKPAVILRPHTEWVEIVEKGCATLAGADESKIINDVEMLLGKERLEFPEIFGDGKAAEFILSKIVELC